ncbi:hypothetical protein DCAR_0208748 [Daucus carota subsp. sativus]|uniref:AB hydrolase-1 domain-containing protein n=1 Tax=Daucus carota subsp. sativus TaxID=79200 RepID=A0AAF0WGI8_DAUCS|nr:hypothetical protein DCAR_0208748 [Daucus carota subsp. sativus]
METKQSRRRISATSARTHTRNSQHKSPIQLSSGLVTKILLVFFAVILAWGYQASKPPPPKICGSPDGPPVTASRIELKDGRHLAYKEYGVPKDTAKHKIVYVHGFDSCRHYTFSATSLTPDVIVDLGIYMVSFDRPGYGESDPDPNRTVKSVSLDIEELADQLGLGLKFYVIGYSMGGQLIWSCLKYIPHRLAGATLIAPVVNYWWPGIPSNLSSEAYYQQFPQDQWSLRVAHYIPWLTYWWNTQKWFPYITLIAQSPGILSRQDTELLTVFSTAERKQYEAQVRQQGEYESLHRDLIIGFGTWEFDPLEVKNPFPGNKVQVHLWQGDEDMIVPVTLQRYIVQKLAWIHYHEVAGAGHLFPFSDGMGNAIIKALIMGGDTVP